MKQQHALAFCKLEKIADAERQVDNKEQREQNNFATHGAQVKLLCTEEDGAQANNSHKDHVEKCIEFFRVSEYREPSQHCK